MPTTSTSTTSPDPLSTPVLKFFTTSNFVPLEVPIAAVPPRLIKNLPAGCTTAGALFDCLRPDGPLYSVRIEPMAGADGGQVGVVQFWSEAHAREAEVRLAASEHSNAHRKIIMNAYDPCALFVSVSTCSCVQTWNALIFSLQNVSFDLTAAVLRTFFTEVGVLAVLLPSFRLTSGRSSGI
ncbi:hypothetical protein B0H11DRAFT_733183 [Mycena galericulata]|nr:hypothetical protein B0H11DRAFT_733183 [Mycena galericulata]